jgi:biotin transport system substrate-specific component
MRIKTRDMTLIALFTVLAVIGGKIVIPVLAIPFTLQTAVCLVTGLLLGWRRALLAQGLYLVMGLLGLPVFAAGGGPAYVLQPSFGYLPGMLLAAGLVGYLADRLDPSRERARRWQLLLVHLAGLAIVYGCGVTYLYLIKTVYSGQPFTLLRALQVGMLPYLISDGTYAVLLALAGPGLRRATRSFLPGGTNARLTASKQDKD